MSEHDDAGSAWTLPPPLLPPPLPLSPPPPQPAAVNARTANRPAKRYSLEPLFTLPPPSPIGLSSYRWEGLSIGLPPDTLQARGDPGPAAARTSRVWCRLG